MRTINRLLENNIKEKTDIFSCFTEKGLLVYVECSKQSASHTVTVTHSNPKPSIKED
jgi:hypothetical protein